jgi:hypothetical protein
MPATSGPYQSGIRKVADDTISLASGVKVMLVKSSYTFNPDSDFVSDLVASEIVATNYTGGHAGAGRKTASLTWEDQDANNRSVIKVADLTWTSLGGATNDTVGAAILFKEGAADSSSVLLACLGIANIATDGNNYTVQFDATNGNVRFTSV